ncbi:MAG: hypothetical protein H6851_05200 [Geminicoccaceae bacterium]|nr:hypothetical protein [Geminicoccaceae bacterium]
MSSRRSARGFPATEGVGSAREIDLGYRPRPLQLEAHRKSRRFTVLVAHRRFGKTVYGVMDGLDRLLRCTLPSPRVAYAAPFRNQAKRIAWMYLKSFTRGIPGVRVDGAELSVTLPGDRQFIILGGENPDAIRGVYFDHIILDEFAQMRPELLPEVVLPALTDRRGSLLIPGTPKGTNEFHRWAMLGLAGEDPDLTTLVYPASKTGLVPEADLSRLRSLMGEAEYEQEFECSFLAAIAGAYYAGELDRAMAGGRITEVPYDPAHEVFTAWDLGLDDATAIWFFQTIGYQLRFIDYLENSDVGLDWYAAALKAKPYAYGRHYLPHDVEVREIGNGARSRLDSLLGLGVKPVEVVPAAPLEDGINAARNLLARSAFDAGKCERGLEALRHYRREWNGKLRVWKARPVHDWSSHAADAFRMAALGLPRSATSRRRASAMTAVTDYRRM